MSDTLTWDLQKSCKIVLFKFQIENWNSGRPFLLEIPKSIPAASFKTKAHFYIHVHMDGYTCNVHFTWIASFKILLMH